MSKQFQKLKKNILRKRRGISPIVAEILLIGLTMLAGAITFGTVVVVMTSKEPITVSINKFSDFKLDGNSSNTQYNSFSFVLDNSGKRAVGIRALDFKLTNATDPTKNMTSWTISRDYELGSLQSYYITAKSSNSSQWLDYNGKIEIQLTAYGLENSYDTADKVVLTASTTITDNLVSVGPLQIDFIDPITNKINSSDYTNLPISGNLSMKVENFGHLNASFTLEFAVSSLNVTMNLKDLNTSKVLPSIIHGTLAPAQGNISTKSDTFSLNTTYTTLPPAKYFIIVWLKIDSTIQDSLIIFYS